MIRSIRKQLSFSIATALLSTSSFAEPPTPVASKEDPSMLKTIAFHISGLMKTQSGAT